MELELKGKVALVTGASRGIGRGIAEMLAAEGCDLMLTARDETALAAVAAAARARGVKAECHGVDLRRDEAPAAVVEALRRHHGRLDILVNNAGHTKRGDFFKLSDEDWQDGFALKFFAHVRLARTAWPLLAENKGSIVIIGGTGGKQPTANSVIGSSVNAACLAFSKALAEIGTKAGVQVVILSPGHVDTDRMQLRIDALKKETGLDDAGARARYRDMLGVNRLGTTRDVAGFVAFIASPRGRWLHGVSVDLHGGQIRPI